MHKKTGAPLPVPTYPRLGRAKTGVFSIAAPAGGAANRGRRATGVALGHGTAQNACYQHAGRRPPTPSRPSRDPARSNRRFRRVCSHPGLLKTPDNARRAPGDPCAPRKTRPHPEECGRGSQITARAQAAGGIPGMSARATRSPRVSRKPLLCVDAREPIPISTLCAKRQCPVRASARTGHCSSYVVSDSFAPAPSVFSEARASNPCWPRPCHRELPWRPSSKARSC